MQKYKVLYKNAKVTSFSSLISKEWKALEEEEKKKWKIIAEQDKLRYNTEKSLYKGPWQVPSERPRKVSWRLFLYRIQVQTSKDSQTMFCPFLGPECPETTTVRIFELQSNATYGTDRRESTREEHGYF